MRVLLVSTYELGHQPLALATAAAALEGAGHEVRCLDLSVDPWDESIVEWAEAAAISVPMHTAMRLGLRSAKMARDSHPELPICLFGLYAAVGNVSTLGSLVDRVITGEYLERLVEWVDGLASDESGGTRATPDIAPVTDLGRHHIGVPQRDALPPLNRYARLVVNGQERLAGYVETSHGCVHRCRHCPVPVVYDGRIRILDHDSVLADIAQLVDAGAEHITFGDPDFLNGPRHSIKVVRSMHERFPELTFDCTTKVEHILRHRNLWGEMADYGCLFVVSAFESTNDAILARLDKGHTNAEAAEAIQSLRDHGIEPRPSFMPFTPWTTLEDICDLIDFVVAHDLVGNVDPVQYTIRLLLPEGSLLLDHPDLAAHLGPYDVQRLAFTWTAADPECDKLQTRLTELVESSLSAEESIGETFEKVRAAVYQAAGRDITKLTPLEASEGKERPHLTEPWFCCAEPTDMQLAALRQ